MKNRRYSRKSRSTGKFRSQFESTFSEHLDKLGVEYGYETDYILYEVPRKYKPDFILPRPNRKPIWERKLYIELKGRFTSADRSKMLEVKNQNSLLDIRLVFMQNNYLYKGSKTRYSDWAEKYGFPYHIVGSTKKLIPDEWLQETPITKSKRNRKKDVLKHLL